MGKNSKSTRTYPDAQAIALQALDGQLGRTHAQLQVVTQQLRAINAQRQQLLAIRAVLCGVLGLDAAQVYRWQPARVHGRQVPEVITPEEVEALLRRQSPPPAAPMTPTPSEALPVAAS